MVRFVLNIKKQNEASLELREGTRLLAKEPLTIGRNFDKLLITSIDKITIRNKIDKLHLKSLEISGKMNEEAVSGMVIEAINSALRV